MMIIFFALPFKIALNSYSFRYFINRIIFQELTDIPLVWHTVLFYLFAFYYYSNFLSVFFSCFLFLFLAIYFFLFVANILHNDDGRKKQKKFKKTKRKELTMFKSAANMPPHIKKNKSKPTPENWKCNCYI